MKDTTQSGEWRVASGELKLKETEDQAGERCRCKQVPRAGLRTNRAKAGAELLHSAGYGAGIIRGTIFIEIIDAMTAVTTTSAAQRLALAVVSFRAASAT